MDIAVATEKLLEFIVDTYMVEREEVPLEESLIDEGIIDSFGLIEIASFLEETFSIKIEDEELIRENFGSIVKMIQFVDRKKNNES